MLFHLVIHKDQDSTYGVTIPSLNGVFSYGDTLEEAIENSKEAILFHLEGILDDGNEPDFSKASLDDVRTDPDYQDAIFVSIDLDVSAFTLKPERFNVSWPKYLIKEVDSYTSKHHDNRSNFLAKAARSYIQQNQ